VGEVFGLGQHIYRGHPTIIAVGAVQGTGLEAPDLEIRTKELFTARAVITLTASDPAMDYHFVANFDVVNFTPSLDHDAGGVGTRDVRQDYFHARQAASRPDIIKIACRRFHLNYHVIRTGLRDGDLGVVENLAVAVTLENNRLHSQVPSLTFSLR
jgi:hypothetical protein